MLQLADLHSSPLRQSTIFFVVSIILHNIDDALQTARAFLEGREGFDAAGRRALSGGVSGGGGGGAGRGEGWMKKAAADRGFSLREKGQLGLPVAPLDTHVTSSSGSANSGSCGKIAGVGADANVSVEDEVAADISAEGKVAAGVSHSSLIEGGAVDVLQARSTYSRDGSSLSATAGAETLGLCTTGSERTAPAAARTGISEGGGDGDPNTDEEQQLSDHGGGREQVDTDILKPRSQSDENVEGVDDATEVRVKLPPEQSPQRQQQQQGSPADGAPNGEGGD